MQNMEIFNEKWYIGVGWMGYIYTLNRSALDAHITFKLYCSN